MQDVIKTSKDDVAIVQCKDQETGLHYAKQYLSDIVDKKTVLFLSGGKTPKNLYKQISLEQKILPGAVALVDERYGKKWHEESNEKMIKDTGFLEYLSSNNIPFFPILEESVTLERSDRVSSRDSIGPTGLQNDDKVSREQTAEDYDETVRYLLGNFPQSLAILGIGVDGHTAGLPPIRESYDLRFKNQELVGEFDDFPGEQKERVTMTFLALSRIDELIVLVFGEDKKNALKKLFSEGQVETIPARFFKQDEIARKTLLITDQKV